MEARAVKRLICVTGLGSGESRGRGGLLYNTVLYLILGRIYADKDAQEWIIRRSHLNWTIARPTVLTNGPRSGAYRVLLDARDWRSRSISRADVADFLDMRTNCGRHGFWPAMRASTVRRRGTNASLKKAAAGKSNKSDKPVAIVSYDEKPGIQAIATTAPDLPPEPGVHATFARDHEYKRHGTLSLLAGIDLLTGKVHALVRDRHRSREFIEFLNFSILPIWPAPPSS
jgi:hypothetical protein